MPTPSQPDDRQPDSAGTLSDAERQRLVAYLDGELPADESSAVESQLAQNDAVRDELQRLERVWNALDALPRTTVDEAFTRSTVAMVVDDAEQEIERLTTSMPVRRRRRRWGAVAACVAAMLVGAITARGLATRNDRRVLANLPVIYQYDALRQFEDPEFLRQLRQRAPDLVAEYAAAEHQHTPVAQRATDWRTLIDGRPADRAAWIAGQPDTEKLRLQRAVKRFHDTPPSARQSARRVLAGIESQPDADRLLATAVAYQAWLATQPATVQSQLRQLDDPTARAAQARGRYNAVRKRAKWRISPTDAEAIRKALSGLTNDPRLRAVPDKVFGRRRPTPRGLGETAGTLMRVRLIAKLNGPKPERGPPPFGRPPNDLQSQLVQHAKKVWPSVEATLVEGLAPDTQQQLAGLKKKQRAARLADWVGRVAIEALRPDDATLEAFFASDALTDAARQELLALPVDEMKRRLGRRYLNDQFGDSPGDDARGPRRGGGPPSNHRRRPPPPSGG